MKVHLCRYLYLGQPSTGCLKSSESAQSLCQTLDGFISILQSRGDFDYKLQLHQDLTCLFESCTSFVNSVQATKTDTFLTVWAKIEKVYQAAEVMAKKEKYWATAFPLMAQILKISPDEFLLKRKAKF